MFKNALIYQINPGWTPDPETLEAALQDAPFVPCRPTQDLSMGWAPPRGQAHGALAEWVAGQPLLKFVVETKRVPSSVINRHLDDKLADIEAKEGRKPGRREQRDLRDEITQQLLPMAFSSQQSILAWLDLPNHRLVLDTANQSRADALTTALTQACAGLQLSLLSTTTSPQAAMTQWVSTDESEWPGHFAVGQGCELKSSDEQKSVVKFTRHVLVPEEMRQHIVQGKLPTQLSMDWDGRVRFTLTEGGVLKSIAFLDGVYEDQASAEDNGGFDADAAICFGELAPLITDLVTALGGELTL